MKIMLDAGHGYNTPGKRSPDGLKEYEFTRAVANYAKKLLDTYRNVTVYFSHSDDRDVPLKERTDLANRLNVDLFVSIHANAFGSAWNNASGIETYVYVTKPPLATALAQKIQRNLITSTQLKNRGVKTADFHVLRETKMDAVLVECGFYTNPEEIKLIRSEDYRKKCADAIVKGIVEQFKLVKEKTSSTSTPTPSQPKPPANPTTKGLYKVQVGAYANRANAEELLQSLESDGYEGFITFE
ncbi:N-acetylmuramoyl-L-alanine amidase [Bacillus sp. CGMCC 1.16607]|uniref:N-acetylmuramoyl-L-alanine amidase n=1 Tax=Bacillus sp. CGMCC 1.16607 TaxID=3351842 RepID=UPI00362A8DA1